MTTVEAFQSAVDKMRGDVRAAVAAAAREFKRTTGITPADIALDAAKQDFPFNDVRIEGMRTNQRMDIYVAQEVDENACCGDDFIGILGVFGSLELAVAAASASHKSDRVDIYAGQLDDDKPFVHIRTVSWTHTVSTLVIETVSDQDVEDDE